MDADIILHLPTTLWNMLEGLIENPAANITVDAPRKDLSFKSNHSLRERLSLGASEITASAPAQLCAQLYCIRAGIARNIYLPKDLGACEDGFIKQLVCTDFLTKPVIPDRILLVPNAEHTFEAYTAPNAIFKNQKRQIIGQTVVHLLVDRYLRTLSQAEMQNLAVMLRHKDRHEPEWLKSLLHEHLEKARFFWRLHPGIFRHRFKTLSKLPFAKRLKCLPAAVAAFSVSVISCWMAFRALKSGTTNYWPKADREGLNGFMPANKDLLAVNPNHP